MKMKLFLTVAVSMLFAMTACDNQTKPQTLTKTQTDSVVEEKPVISTIDLVGMEADTLKAFKGGDGEVYMKMFVDGGNRIMYCTTPPGASVGYHTHDTNMEVIYVIEGTATVFFDHNEQIYTKGMAHYCPKGHGHSIHNFGEEDLVIYNVIAPQP